MNKSDGPNEYGVHVFLSITTLISCIRGRTIGAIPAVIIQNICEELEHASSDKTQQETSPPPNIALQKYLKNRDVRAVSHVCKSWRSYATAFMCLWRDIAFDVAEPKSTRLAASFLSVVEDQDVLLRIYAGFGYSNHLDPDLTKLLGDLRRNTRRWMVFEYQGALGEYYSYLDLPAPNLRYFSDHGNSSRNERQLFSGCMPSLRHLLASSTRGWDSTTLSNLTEFHFGQPACGPSPSLNSLLDLFRNTPGLETLRLEWLGSFVHDCAADTTVSLPRLRTLEAYNTDFDALAEHIFIPNIHDTVLTVGTPTHPSFQAPHALTGLFSIPIHDRPISEVLVVVAHTTDEGTFRIRLKIRGGGSFDVCLMWDTDILEHWKSYITETLSTLAGRIQLDPGAILRLFLGICPSRSSSQGAYKINGGFARRFFRALAGPERPQVISPPLIRRLLIAKDTPVLDEDETQMFRLCLRSRATCEAGLFVRVRHGSLPWLCGTDLECNDECKYVLRVSMSPFLIPL